MLAAIIGTACGGGGDQQTSGSTDTAAPPAVAAGNGAQLYQERCVSCHQANGEGLAGSFPPLAGSEFATAANVEVPIRVVLHGVSGPLMVKGQKFDGLMPQFGLGIDMSNEEVAAVLTYVRSSWGNTASAITPEDVAAVKSKPRTASGSMTEEELQALMKVP